MQANTSAAVSGGVATSAMIVIAWLFALMHIAIPDSVQVALASLLTAGLGYFFHTRGVAIAAAAEKAKAAAAPVAALLVLIMAGALSACTGTPNLGPLPTQTIINIGCAADALAPGFVKAGTAIAAISDPSIVDQLAQANQADALAHAAVQSACALAIPGGKPVTEAPVSVPLPVPLPPAS